MIQLPLREFLLKLSVFSFQICKHIFLSSKILRTHMESHDSEPKYECAECGKKFKSRAMWQHHGRLHSKVNLSHITQKLVLRSLLMSYQKKAWLGWCDDKYPKTCSSTCTYFQAGCFSGKPHMSRQIIRMLAKHFPLKCSAEMFLPLGLIRFIPLGMRLFGSRTTCVIEVNKLPRYH